MGLELKEFEDMKSSGQNIEMGFFSLLACQENIPVKSHLQPKRHQKKREPINMKGQRILFSHSLLEDIFRLFTENRLCLVIVALDNSRRKGRRGRQRVYKDVVSRLDVYLHTKVYAGKFCYFVILLLV